MRTIIIKLPYEGKEVEMVMIYPFILKNLKKNIDTDDVLNEMTKFLNEMCKTDNFTFSTLNFIDRNYAMTKLFNISCGFQAVIERDDGEQSVIDFEDVKCDKHDLKFKMCGYLIELEIPTVNDFKEPGNWFKSITDLSNGKEFKGVDMVDFLERKVLVTDYKKIKRKITETIKNIIGSVYLFNKEHNIKKNISDMECVLTEV